MKINRRQLIGLSFIICHLSFSAALLSCSDWDDHYEGKADASAASSSETLWTQLKANAQLSDFCEVLEQTKVFRMHKKTSVSYADLLKGGQTFTVVAPVNGSFNKDSLLQLVETAQGDSMVEKSFVKNLLSNSLRSVRADEAEMVLLNNKHVTIANGMIQGIQISQPNQTAKNGIIHVAAQPLPFQPNLYEMLCDDPRFSALGKLLRSYEEDYFDEESSVSSGIVDGVPIYVDSVILEHNAVLGNWNNGYETERIGLLNAEDSVYWMVVPSGAAWDNAYAAVSKYFTYDGKMDEKKRDSLQQKNTLEWLLCDAIFNMSNQKSVNDSILSVQYIYERPNYSSPKPYYHVFKSPFAAGGILDPAKTTVRSCSNGLIYEAQEWPFDFTRTFFRPLWVEGERTWLITEYNKCTYNTRQQVADSISENSYLRILPTDGTANWDMTFRVNNTLSGSYDIGIVVLPKAVYDQKNPNLKPCKFKANINYTDEKGVVKSYACQNSAGKSEFTTDPEHVDTLWVAENFAFPACGYGQPDMKVSLKLTCSIGARETSKYNREFYLDCIYLRPRP